MTPDTEPTEAISSAPGRVPSAPLTERFQPVRAGIINMYEYGNEVFEFSDGHLLLRGTNGTGKSVALSLLEPFVMCGDTSPHKLDPFGSSARGMKWNLLMNGAYRTRTGYVWKEFGRTVDGQAEWITGIVGLSASEDQKGVKSWFVVLNDGRRVGIDVRLVSDGSSCPRSGLHKHLGCEVIDGARDYRQQLNNALFGYQSLQRYETMLELQRQLRRPKIDSALDPETLSKILSQSLPELNHEFIGDIGASLDTIEQERRNVADLTSLRDRFVSFCGTYSEYARAAVRKRGSVLAETEQKFAKAQARVEDLTAALADRETSLMIADQREVELADTLQRSRGAETELLASDAMKAANGIRQLRNTVRVAQEAAERARLSLGNATSALAETSEQRNHISRQRDETASEVEADGSLATLAARSAGIAAHEDMIGGDARSDEYAVRALSSQRREQINQQRSLRRKAEAAAQTSQRLLEQADAAQEAASQIAGEAQRTETELGAERGALAARIQTWAEQVTQIQIDEPTLERLREACEGACEDADLRPHDVVQNAVIVHREHVAVTRAEINSERDRLATSRKDLLAEMQRLRTTPDMRPEPPSWRIADRRDRQGAALWEIVEFADQVSDEQQSSLEAALHASGLLDAWILDSGEILGLPGDVALTPQAESAANDRLQPLVAVRNSAVPVEVIDRVLSGVRFVHANADRETGACVIGLDGSFRSGPAAGRHIKPSAQYIGLDARHRERDRRVAEITAELVRMDALASGLDARDDATQRSARMAEHELAALPSDNNARTLARALGSLTRDLSKAREVATQLQTQADAAGVASAAVRSDADEHARSASLPTPADGSDALEALEGAVHAYDRRCADWLASRLRLAGLIERQSTHDGLVAGMTQREASARVEDQRAHDALSEHTGALDAVQASAGEEPSLVLRRLESVRLEIRSAERERGDVRLRRDELVRAKADVDANLSVARTAVEETAAARAEAASRFFVLAEHDFFTLALEQAAPSAAEIEGMDVTHALAFVARHENSLATRASEQTLANSVDAAYTDLRVLLDGAAVAQPFKDFTSDGLLVVAVERRGQRQTIRATVASLDEEIAAATKHLTEEDERLFEFELCKHVAREVREMIRNAHERLARTNEVLDGCKTSSGIEMRLRWQPREDEEDPLLARALTLLDRDIDLLTDDERTALSVFFRGRVDRARGVIAEDASEELLIDALDYRAWHEFKLIQVKNGVQTKVTKAVHQSGSGGEKSAGLIIPLLAAAAAHFSSARPSAPRMIMLDEVFTTVDAPMTRKLLGLMESFDLDFVFTSEKLFCCYPELAGLTIYDLHRQVGGGAIASWMYRWDGRTRTDCEPDAIAA